MSTNGIEQAAEDGAGGVGGEQRARSAARVRGLVAEQRRRVGKAMPSTIVTGRTTRSDVPRSAVNVPTGRPGRARRARRSRAPARAIASTATRRSGCRPGARSGSRIRDRTTVKMTAPMASPIRNVARIDGEDVRRVARPGREQAGPGDLVAERGQARRRTRRPAPAVDAGRMAARPRPARCPPMAARIVARPDATTKRREPGHAPSTPRRPPAHPDSPSSSISTKPASEVPTDRPDGVRGVQPAEGSG